jgi:hypothetical protein
MTPDFETVKQLWTTARDLTITDRQAERASKEVERLLPDDLWDEMAKFETDSPEFESAFRKHYEPKPPIDPGLLQLAAEEAEIAEIAADDSILPFPGFPGYGLDSWGRPHGVSGKRRKRGPLAAILRWKPRKKGQKPRFIYGYRLSLGGKQLFKSALTCAIARSNAERSLWESQL